MATLGVLATPASAQTLPGTTQFIGQVISITGPAANPTGFTLMRKDRSVDIRIAPRATFTPRSTEAEVEGFQRNDYAVVTARRVNRAWVAIHIDFDVQPVTSKPVNALVNGTVLKVTANGRHFSMTIDAFTSRWVLVTLKTKFRVDGQPIDSPPPLNRGDVVQVLMRPTKAGWVALEINLRVSTLLARLQRARLR